MASPRLAELDAWLRKELALMGKLLHPERPVTQLHLGGGTPTFFLPEEIRALGRMVRERFKGEEALCRFARAALESRQRL